MYLTRAFVVFFSCFRSMRLHCGAKRFPDEEEVNLVLPLNLSDPVLSSGAVLCKDPVFLMLPSQQR